MDKRVIRRRHIRPDCEFQRDSCSSSPSSDPSGVCLPPPGGKASESPPVNLPRHSLSAGAEREEALLQALVSTHAVLTARGGEFISLLDPPEGWREIAAVCENQGVWPVLVGEEGALDTVLASPIILYDYPKIAPESPGDLFDGLEIDEILSLRIMTLTDEEKAQAVAVDARAGALLARTEALAREELSKLHGGVKSVRATEGGA